MVTCILSFRVACDSCEKKLAPEETRALAELRAHQQGWLHYGACQWDCPLCQLKEGKKHDHR